MRSVRVVAAMAVLISACTGAGTEDPETTVPTAPSVTTPAPPVTTTTPADPFVVPAVIDVAYVNRVLAALDQVNGDLVRFVVAERMVGQAVTERSRAIYNDPEFEIDLEVIQGIPAEDLTKYRTPPGDRRTEVRRILSSKPDCIAFEAVVDFSAVVIEPPPLAPNEREVIVLAPTQPGADPKDLNPTPWSIRYQAVITDGETDEEATCTG